MLWIFFLLLFQSKKKEQHSSEIKFQVKSKFPHKNYHEFRHKIMHRFSLEQNASFHRRLLEQTIVFLV